MPAAALTEMIASANKKSVWTDNFHAPEFRSANRLARISQVMRNYSQPAVVFTLEGSRPVARAAEADALQQETKNESLCFADRCSFRAVCVSCVCKTFCSRNHQADPVGGNRVSSAA